jgi:hypothetical protein
LINASSSISDDDFRKLVEFLLENRMRSAICCGINAEHLADVLNEMLEGGDYHEDGRTAMTIAYEEEPIEEVLEYFALPDGVGSASLLLNIGNDRVFKTTLTVFTKVVERMELELSS